MRDWACDRVKCWLERKGMSGVYVREEQSTKIVGESAPRGADQWYIITRSSSTHSFPIIRNNKGIIATRTIKQFGPIYPTLLPFINAFKSSPVDLLNLLIKTCTPHLCMHIVYLLINFDYWLITPLILHARENDHGLGCCR